jgi:hypothetical protein
MVVFPGLASAQRYAVLMSGFDWANFQSDLSHVYKTLLQAGYTKDEIHVLYHKGEQLDLDGDTAFDDVDDSCYKDDFAEAFASIIGQGIDSGNTIFFFATGHGSAFNQFMHPYPSYCVFTADYADTLWDYELANQLTALEMSAGGPLRKICLIAPCRSGGFTVDSNWPEPADLTELNQISISTTASSEQKATWSDDAVGYPMVYWWTSALRGKDWNNNNVDADANHDQHVSLSEAFAFAKNESESATETPQHLAKDCLLDNFSGVNGGLFDLPILTINMTRCPPPDHHPWIAHDCYGYGLTATTTLGTGARASAVAAAMEARARLANGGTAPSQTGALHYYYRAPTLGLGFYGTGWQAVGTQSIPPLAPGESLEMPPVAFSVPELNPFGEPYWTVAARIEDPANPAGSGWLSDDHQVRMANSWTIAAAPGASREIHFLAVNPSSEPAMVVLGVDTSRYPDEWHFQVTPQPYDTVLFSPYESRVVTLTLQAVGTGHTEGTIHVIETLLPSENYGACRDPSCGGPPCGGFIRETGGCAVTLVTEPPTAVVVSLVDAEAEWDRVRLTWFAADAAGFFATLYRCSPGDAWHAIGSVRSDGTGRISYEDRDVIAGARYGYRLAVREGSDTSFLGETWIDVPRRFELALQDIRPNPTWQDLLVTFSLPSAAPASLELLDIAGRRVLMRDVGSLGPGSYVLNLGQNAVPAGVYLVRLRQGPRAVYRKGTVLR